MKAAREPRVQAISRSSSRPRSGRLAGKNSAKRQRQVSYVSAIGVSNFETGRGELLEFRPKTEDGIGARCTVHVCTDVITSSIFPTSQPFARPAPQGSTVATLPYYLPRLRLILLVAYARGNHLAVLVLCCASLHSLQYLDVYVSDSTKQRYSARAVAQALSATVLVL